MILILVSYCSVFPFCLVFNRKLTDSCLDLYAFDGEGPAPRLTTHHLVKKVSQFPIRMPNLDGVKPGDKVNMTIRMFFGLTEIKIECVIRDKIFVFTSAFDATDSFANGEAIGTPGSQSATLRHTQAFVPSPSVTSLPLGTPQMNSPYPAYPSPGAPMLPSSNLPQHSFSSVAQQDPYGTPQQDPYGTPQQQQAYPPMNQGYPPQQTSQQPYYNRQSTYDSYNQPQGGYYSQDPYASPAPTQGGRRPQQQQQQQPYPPY